jgi:putative flippase GtrA
MSLPKYLYRFILVSLLSTIIDIGSFNLLFLMVNNKDSIITFVILKLISFLLAVTNSYLLNSKWTFDSNQGSVKTFGQFLVINIFAFGVNILTATIVFALIQRLSLVSWLSANISVVSGSIVGMSINLKGYKRLFLKK